jgi:hypothetical protein
MPKLVMQVITPLQSGLISKSMLQSRPESCLITSVRSGMDIEHASACSAINALEHKCAAAMAHSTGYNLIMGNQRQCIDFLQDFRVTYQGKTLARANTLNAAMEAAVISDEDADVQQAVKFHSFGRPAQIKWVSVFDMQGLIDA